MSAGLPGCDDLFMKYFDQWYTPESRAYKGLSATRPDAMGYPDLVGAYPKSLSPYTEESQAEIGEMVNGMIRAAEGDWPTFLPVSKPIDIKWIDEFDKHFDEHRAKALIEGSDPDDFGNELLVTCCEFGAVLGQVLLTAQPNLHWVYLHPYWESSIFDPETGLMVAVFHWAIKKFSSYGIDDGFRAKLNACSEMIARQRRMEP